MTENSFDTTRFGLLRHGKTVWNEEKRIQGSGNSELTPTGIEGCERWARFLVSCGTTWHRFLVSPLQRTIDTAEIINKELALPLQVEEGFREQDWGSWEGLTLQEIKESSPGILEDSVKHGWEFRPPGGESRKEVLGRVIQAIRLQAQERPAENLLVITHLGVIKTMLYHIEKREFLPEEPQIVWKDRFHIISSSSNVLAIEQSNIRLPGLP
jgi:broad specificity phosphatase PhoE